MSPGLLTRSSMRVDEVDEARRRIMAEHGNDYRKVLAYYVEADQGLTEDAATDEATPPAPR